MNRQQTLSADDLNRLLTQVRETMRFKRYSPRTEEMYLDWVRHYLRFHGHRHPAALGTADIEAFLTHVAAKRHVTATTQRQALCALILQGRSHSHTHQATAFVPEGWVKIAHRFNGGGTCRPAPLRVPEGRLMETVSRPLYININDY